MVGAGFALVGAILALVLIPSRESGAPVQEAASGSAEEETAGGPLAPCPELAA